MSGGCNGQRHPRGPEGQAGQDGGRETAFEVLVEHRLVDPRKDVRGSAPVPRVGGGRVTQECSQDGCLGALAADIADDHPAALLIAEDVVEVSADFTAGAGRAEVALEFETRDAREGPPA